MSRFRRPGAAKRIKDEIAAEEYDMSHGQEQALLPDLSALKHEYEIHIEEHDLLQHLWMEEPRADSRKIGCQTKQRPSSESANSEESLPEQGKAKLTLTQRLFSSTVVLRDCAAELQHSGRYCQECRVLFSSCSALAQHNSTASTLLKESPKKSNTKKKFKCLQCEKSFTLHNNYIVHLRLHSGIKNYKCSMCRFKTTRSDTLNDHLKTHTGEKHLKCDHCNYRSNKKNNMQRHIRTHTKEKPYKCNLCEYRCGDKSALLSHTRNRHMEKNKDSVTKKEEKLNPCGLCEFRGVNKNELRIHLRIHTGEKPFKCDLCEYRCTRKQHLKSHAAVHAKKSFKMKKCSLCDVTYTRETQLLNHMKIHNETLIKTEMQNEHNEKAFKCNLCEYKTDFNYRFKDHFKIHTGEKPYQCDKCEYRCGRKQSLRKHMRKHVGERTRTVQSYKCCCGFICNKKVTFDRHLRSKLENICGPLSRPKKE